MADIAASDVTVTILTRVKEKLRWRNKVKITFGNATLTYPSGGVPMPAIGAFGFTGVLENLIITDDDDAQGVLHKWNAEANKIKAWFPTQQITSTSGNRVGVEYTAATTAPAATTIYAEAVGW